MLFEGIKVYFVKSSIPLAVKRVPLWTEKVEKLGGDIEKNANESSITHVLVGPKTIKVPKELRSKLVIDVQWLVECLSVGKVLPTEKFIADLSGETKPTEISPKPDTTKEEAPMRRYEAWLGHWSADYNKITNVIELMLHAKYSVKDSLNGPLVKLLNELQKFELAVQNEHSTIGDDPNDIINHKALQYARAVCVARACSYKLTPENLSENDLPFVGPATRTVMQNLLLHGTCPELEAFREGSVVTDSKGKARPETIGGDVKRLFKSLPGVGVGVAKAWYDAGFRSFEDVIEGDRALSSGEAPTPDRKEHGKTWMTKTLRFALSVHQDLVEGCSEEDVKAMHADLQSSFKAVTGKEWSLTLVGGGRRSVASHDADFVASHPEICTDGVVQQLVEHMVDQGRLVSREKGMCALQTSRRILTEDELHRSPAGTGKASHNLLADRHDHLLGIYITREGKHRRMDVIVSTWRELPFCLISWTGSKQYMRFMRQYAVLRGMHMNAHRIMTQVKGAWYHVPEERGPHDRDQKEYWPDGWNKERMPQSEKDVFELLGIPWREAWERNC